MKKISILKDEYSMLGEGQCPAKLNLFLKITGKRSNGYHELVSLMQEIDLCDKIQIAEDSQDQFTVRGPYKVEPNSNNLVIRALNIFREYTNSDNKYKILLEKNIPFGAGLGGGSSDAATTLLLLNELNKSDISDEELMKLGSKLGADVPFFIKGGTAICSGIGDIVNPLAVDSNLNLKYLIVYPNIVKSTSDIYKKYSATLSLTNKNNIAMNFYSLIHNLGEKKHLDEATLKEFPFENDLEFTVKTMYPVINVCSDFIFSVGCHPAMVCGAGTALYGIIPKSLNISEIKSRVSEVSGTHNWEFFISNMF